MPAFTWKHAAKNSMIFFLIIFLALPTWLQECKFPSILLISTYTLISTWQMLLCNTTYEHWCLSLVTNSGFLNFSLPSLSLKTQNGELSFRSYKNNNKRNISAQGPSSPICNFLSSFTIHHHAPFFIPLPFIILLGLPTFFSWSHSSLQIYFLPVLSSISRFPLCPPASDTHEITES